MLAVRIQDYQCLQRKELPFILWTECIFLANSTDLNSMNSCTHGIAAIAIALSLLLSACGQEKPANIGSKGEQDSESFAPDEVADEGVSDNAIAGILVKREASDQDVEQRTKGFEDSLELESDSDSLAAKQKNTLVEDMGFSTEKATELDVEQEAVAAPFCLGSEKPENAVTAAQACDQIANRLASVSHKRCNAASLQASSCMSVNGFPIFIREFPPVENRKPQGRVLVIGGIHGDELTSVSIVFKWIAKLNKFHSGLFHWHVVPMMNPDGVLNRGAERTNKNGVDLNRNLPSDDWQENALKYWRHKQGENPRRYPGEQPASEPETQWLIDEINDFKPDAIISVHAPYGVVDFDALLLNTAPKSLGKLHLNLLGTYPGSLGNYAGINRNIPVITLELPHAWDMPSEQETSKIWEDIVSWLRKNVNTEIADNDGY